MIDAAIVSTQGRGASMPVLRARRTVSPGTMSPMSTLVSSRIATPTSTIRQTGGTDSMYWSAVSISSFMLCSPHP